MVIKISKVLVANRGEIALRIMRSCREMGIKTVAVYSEVDRTSMHVRYADRAYSIGPAPSNESYLNIEKIIEVAKLSKVDAIHPGYGFLSENATFCQRCQQEGIIFIGPSPEVIRTMGDKITARSTMLKSGVPVVPGTNTKLTDDEKVVDIINKIGLPVMIKASAGGGGKGMRLVEKKSEILSSLRGARSEAKTAFGDDTVYIEKYIASPHHIEFQILGDQYGNVIHLCERECSVQRRHQKVVEETPSPIMNAELREKMGQHAIAAAKAVNYYGAGTIEFLVDDQLNFYFLEMNTRLQVEHPITERVTGYDIVKQQILIAEGSPLEIKQEQVIQFGHAIEARIYAEDTDNNFMPSPGLVTHITEPLGLGVRTDGYVFEGYRIPMDYDPMISKLIVSAPTRNEAIERMRRALYEYKITGVKTNIKFLERIMDCPDFKEGNYNTHFIKNNETFLLASDEAKIQFEDLAIVTAFMDYHHKTKKCRNGFNQTGKPSRWKDFHRSQNVKRIN
ncbi:MAG: acetyl-CoA carboxylase biotin carboxylase subunit [Bacteroidetes bacterium HGW-Bacteroidetes-4]|jgi:acetyl-CoA carboxylase biotin carboxylase subunit|nr:MAG: acetyl-CoA carboxylase biotin carboxylase subunit [Bacteroidetes bacterium HGW-Bacteroidetes-4]